MHALAIKKSKNKILPVFSTIYNVQITKQNLKKLILEELKTLLEDMAQSHKARAKDCDPKKQSCRDERSEFEQSTPADPKNLDPVHHYEDYIRARLQKVFDPKTYKKKKNK